MSNIIKPTIGRKVWYRPSKWDREGRGGMQVACDQSDTTKFQPLDATIIAVWGDRMVNVMVTDIMGRQFPLTSVKLMQEGDLFPVDANGENTGGYVEWMPYQAGQARKDAAIDRAIIATTPIGASQAAPIHIDASNPSIPPAPAVVARGFSLDSDAPLVGACDLSGEGTCEACQ